MISSIGLLAVEVFNSQKNEASIASEYADSKSRYFLFVNFIMYFLLPKFFLTIRLYAYICDLSS